MMTRRTIFGLVWWGMGFLLVACGGNSPQYQWLKAPGWSRALAVGSTQVGDPAPVAVDEQGNSYLFLISGETESRPRLLAYAPQMTQRWEVILPLSLTLPDKPNLYWRNDGLDVFWLSERTLFYARLNGDGDILVEPAAISPEDVPIDAYSVAYDEDQVAHIWFSGPRRSPGLYAMTLKGETPAAALVDANGIAPVIIMDANHTLHAVWAYYPSGAGTLTLLYASYPNGNYVSDQEIVVVETNVSSTSILRGPELGLDDELVYLFWTIEIRTGPQAGVIDSRYVTFLPSDVTTISPSIPLKAPIVTELAYQEWAETDIMAGARVAHLEQNYPMSGSMNGIVTNKAIGSELPIAFHNANVRYESRQTNGQVALLFMEKGQPTSYQLLSYSTGSPHVPFLISNRAGELYLTWLEAASPSGFTVFLTSTAPEMVDALGQLSGNDVVKLGGTTIFGMLSGMVLSPLVVSIWLIAPMIIVGLAFFFQGGFREDELTTGGLISISLGVVTYWVVKLVSLPNLFVYVPFSAWIPIIPPWLEFILRYGLPVFITLVGIITAWWFTIRRHVASPLYFMLIFGLVDGVLTLAVHGIYFFNLL